MVAPKDDPDKLLREAVQLAIAQSVVGVVGKDGKGVFGGSIGTGTLVRWCDTECILTAEHVVRGCTASELRFFLPASVALTNPEPPATIPLDQMLPRESLNIEREFRDPDLDVALLTIAPGVRPTTWNSCEIKKRWQELPVPSDTELYFMMMGYPASRSQKFFSGNVVIKNVDYPALVDLGSRSLANFDPKKHILTDFPSADKFDPGGYSGAGLWVNKASSGQVWKAQPVYAAMEIGYYRQSKLLKSVAVNAIVDYLETLPI